MTVPKKLIQRYQELKQQVPDCILLMQVGIFMQVMNDDVQTLSKLTGLKRQATGDADNPTIVGGFPESGLNKYVGCLVRAGYSVAIAFQDESTKERYIKEIIRLQK